MLPPIVNPALASASSEARRYDADALLDEAYASPPPCKVAALSVGRKHLIDAGYPGALVKSVLEVFVPSAADAIEVVKGRVVLVDGTLTPCWSYEAHHELGNNKHKTTGFNAQLISLLDGAAVWISGPLPGKTHDAKAFKETGAADIVKEAGGGFGDKGYQGSGLVTPKKKPKGGELTLSDKKYNSQISSFRAPVEQLVAHFKNWKMFHTDYRRPYATYHDAFDATRALFFFSITWVLNNAQGTPEKDS